MGGKSMPDLATTLATKFQIDMQLDDLIKAAAEKVPILEGKGMKENQIRNLVNVATGTTSLEAVSNFIRYQIGRDKNRWQDFGKMVIHDLESGAIREALERVMKSVHEADRESVRAELVRLYLGYLNRCFTYADKTPDWRNLCGPTQAKEE
jgi:hypothetical protein